MVYANFSSNLPTGLQHFEFVDLTIPGKPVLRVQPNGSTEAEQNCSKTLLDINRSFDNILKDLISYKSPLVR